MVFNTKNVVANFVVAFNQNERYNISMCSRMSFKQQQNQTTLLVYYVAFLLQDKICSVHDDCTSLLIFKAIYFQLSFYFVISF